MSKTVSDFRFYTVRRTATPVTVKVSTEFAQVGATTAWIGKRHLANEDENSDRKKWKQEWLFDDLGSGKELCRVMEREFHAGDISAEELLFQ